MSVKKQKRVYCIKPNDARKMKGKLKGWTILRRGVFLELALGHITTSEFILWLLLYALAIWDNHNHPEIYGSTDLTDEILAAFLGKSASTVCKTKNSLIEKGYLKNREDGRLEIRGFEFLDKDKKGKITYFHNFIETTNQMSEQIQPLHSKRKEQLIEENIEFPSTKSEFKSYIYPKDLVSFKGTLGLEDYIDTDTDINLDEITRELGKSI